MNPEQNNNLEVKAYGFSVNRANKDFAFECSMNEGRLIQTFCSAALRTHVPAYVLDLYAADHKQLPGLFLNITRINPEKSTQDTHLSIMLKGKEIARADVIHTLSEKAFVVMLTNAIISACQSTPEASPSSTKPAT